MVVSELKDVCRTRWVERVDGMDVFKDLFVPVYYLLLVIKENNDTVHYNNEPSVQLPSEYMSLIESRSCSLFTRICQSTFQKTFYFK